jgi:hypothetical protein
LGTKNKTGGVPLRYSGDFPQGALGIHEVLERTEARNKVKIAILKRKILRRTAVEVCLWQRLSADLYGNTRNIDSGWFSA